jgi:hypothetical protein
MSKQYEAEARAREIRDTVTYKLEKKTAENRAKYEARFGTFGRYILDAGDGGGFTAIPHAIDMYQAALGLSIKEAWYMKLICRYLPNIYPSMSGIAKRTGVREAELSAIKNGLKKRTGFIDDKGAKDKRGGKLQHELNITPFFDAVFLCILCDADSKIVKSQAMDKVRTTFTDKWQDSKDAECYAKQEDFGFTDLPLTVEQAKKFAEMRGITLNWQAIESMQNGAALEKLESMKLDKMRMLTVKDAISAGINEVFGFVYYGKTYDWLKWLCGTGATDSEIESLTASYVKQYEQPNAKEYMRWMRDVIESPENAKKLAERGVYHAVREAVYAE